MARYAYWQDRIVPADTVAISPYDLGFLRGYGVFDVMRTENGKPFLLERHWERLANSADMLGLKLPIDATRYRETLADLLAKNAFPQSTIRTVLTGGQSESAFTPEGKETFIILIEPFTPLDDRYYRDGAKLITLDYARSWPAAKVTNYVAAIRENARKVAADALEVLFVSGDRALEASTSNFGIILGETLVMPGEAILRGVTRGLVLELAREAGLKTEERPVALDEVFAADEMFLTATNKYIVPVVRVDDRTIGSGEPGERTRALMAALRDYCARY